MSWQSREHEVKVESKDLVVVSASDWAQVSIPLSEFANDQFTVNTASVRNVNFGFNKNHGAGIICVDDIAFAP